MKITAINRQSAGALRTDVLPALNAALQPFGLVAQISGTVGYAPGVSMTAKIEFVALGAAQSPTEALEAIARADWERNAPSLEMPADAFGKTITIGAHQYRILGFATKRGEKVLLEQLRSGVRKQAMPDVVIKALGAAA